MEIVTQKISPCLWFDTEAEEAANFYVSVFDNSRIINVARYPSEGQEVHGKDAGSVMAVDFELFGQRFVGLNGGPQFNFSEAISFQLFAPPRRRSTISGASSPMAGKRDPAAGSRTATDSPGRSFPSRCCG